MKDWRRQRISHFLLDIWGEKLLEIVEAFAENNGRREMAEEEQRGMKRSLREVDSLPFRPHD